MVGADTEGEKMSNYFGQLDALYQADLQRKTERLNFRELVQAWDDYKHKKSEPHDIARAAFLDGTVNGLADLVAARIANDFPSTDPAELNAAILKVGIQMGEGKISWLKKRKKRRPGACAVSEEQFREVYEKHGGNISKTKEELGYATRNSIYNWLEKLGLK